MPKQPIRKMYLSETEILYNTIGGMHRAVVVQRRSISWSAYLCSSINRKSFIDELKKSLQWHKFFVQKFGTHIQKFGMYIQNNGTAI